MEIWLEGSDPCPAWFRCHAAHQWINSLALGAFSDYRARRLSLVHAQNVIQT